MAGPIHCVALASHHVGGNIWRALFAEVRWHPMTWQATSCRPYDVAGIICREPMTWRATSTGPYDVAGNIIMLSTSTAPP